MSELRKDPVVERWVLVADDALRSPVIPRAREHIGKDLLCPFCPGNEHLCPPDIFAYAPDGSGSAHSGWQLRVIPNRSPLLMVEEGHRRSGEGLYDKITGVGANEVFIETPEHDIRQSQMSPAQLEGLIWAYQSRIHDLRKDGRIRSVYIYKNCGVQAGATLDHGYSLLVALPIVPRALAEEMEGARRHFLIKERCIYCDVIQQETSAETRLVAESRCFIAIEPFAPRLPFETWILPRRHAPRFEHIEPAEVHELALIFREVMSRIDAGLCSPDYNYWIHSAPFGNECDPYYHWHMEILPRITPSTGLEGGTDLHYNTTLPEDAAEYLRRLAIS
jgi:UDPglucose--hexose-1-phosphate uridylyltransferase